MVRLALEIEASKKHCNFMRLLAWTGEGVFFVFPEQCLNFISYGTGLVLRSAALPEQWWRTLLLVVRPSSARTQGLRDALCIMRQCEVTHLKNVL
jgi:hypothetical protein